MTSESRMQPDWARMPPHAPTYVNTPTYFRRTPAESYTAPVNGNKLAYQQWWDKWHYVHPEWRQEHYRDDPHTPVMRKIAFQSGTLPPTFLGSPEKPPWRQEYHCIETPVSQTVRARGFYRFNTIIQQPNLYPFSNHMTSTQYKKPVTALYGPMLRERVNGVNTQSNRHGFMPAQDFYF